MAGALYGDGPRAEGGPVCGARPGAGCAACVGGAYAFEEGIWGGAYALVVLEIGRGGGALVIGDVTREAAASPALGGGGRGATADFG